MKLEINEKQLALLNQMVCKAIQDVQYIQWSNTPDFKYWLDEDDAKDLDPIGGWNVPQDKQPS